MQYYTDISKFNVGPQRVNNSLKYLSAVRTVAERLYKFRNFIQTFNIKIYRFVGSATDGKDKFVPNELDKK